MPGRPRVRAEGAPDASMIANACPPLPFPPLTRPRARSSSPRRRRDCGSTRRSPSSSPSTPAPSWRRGSRPGSCLVDGRPLAGRDADPGRRARRRRRSRRRSRASSSPRIGPSASCYEDDALLVLDKPTGLTVHPGSGRSRRHARQRAGPPPAQSPDDRRARPAGHRPSARQGHERRDADRQDRGGSSGAVAGVRRARGAQGVRRRAPRPRRGRARAHRAAARPLVRRAAPAWRCAPKAVGRR